jgi:YesN/AraC family two-component response regulator
MKLAASASEALPAIETFHPDLVMSDINLPDGNGGSLIGQIK